MRVVLTLFIIMEVDILTNGLYNAALYKPSVQSSTHGQFFAKLGVDGINDDDVFNGHCQHTLSEVIPWWMVDLRGQFVVDTIRLTNRGEQRIFSLRLRSFTIDIFQRDPRNLSNFPNISGDVCYNQTAPLSSGTYNFTCSAPTVGRFVRLVMKLNTTDSLHICEMEVLVRGVSIKENIFVIHRNIKLLGTVLNTLAVRDHSRCIQECLSRRSSTCTAFNWVTTSKTCQLFNVDPSIDLTSNLTSSPGTNFYLQNNFL